MKIEPVTQERLEEVEQMIDSLECPWIVIDYKEGPNKYRCLRCGSSDHLREGISLTYFINLSRAFRLTHALCEEQNDKTGS